MSESDVDSAEIYAVSVEIDGEGVEPSTAPAAQLLRLAAAYFAALEKLATREHETGLGLLGIEVVDKCAQIRTRTTNPELAREVTQAALAFARGTRVPPHGTKGEFDEVWRAMNDLRGFSVVLGAGTWRKAVVLTNEFAAVPRSGELGTWRVQVLSVGGASPSVKFRTPEFGAFVMSTTEAIAKQLAAELYKEVSLTASLVRDRRGRVSGGELVSFETIDDGAAEQRIQRLRDWYAEVSPELDPELDLESQIR